MTVAGTEMENYGYLPGNGPLQTVTYANGEVLTNVFDRQNRLVGQKWNGTTISSCEYDDSGLLMKKTDTAEGITCEYGYDMTGRLVSQRTSHGQELEIGYDDRNRVSSLVQKLDSAKVKTKYLYGDPEAQQKPGLLYGMEVDGNKRQSIQYDSLGRKRLVYLHLNDGAYRYHGYQYESNAASGTTHLLPRYYTVDGGWYWYKYDEAGNIVTLSHKDGETTKVIYYQYDSLNQLIRENNQVLDKTICYTYDLGGNLTMRSEYAYTTGSLSGKTAVAEYPYTYRSAGWKDQLVSYNSQAITYDDMGNPLSWKGKGLTWEKGRRLSKISNADGSTLAAFGYDSEGNRVRKTVAASGVTTRYYLNGGKLVGMKQGNQTVQFVYDPDGAPFLMRVNGVDYYYLFNGQGDVTGLVDKSNNLVVSYVYDSWGKPISTSGSDADGIGSLNPLRYRGYVWDAESGLYYMGSRYYDPEVGRFLNVDRIVSSIGGAMQGYNLYAYCFDNPVNRTDSSGNWPEWLEEFGKELERRAKHTVDIFGRILMSPLNALELEIGVGYGYGMEISKDITGKDLSVDAGLKIREAIICSSKGVDIVSTASVGVDTSIINDRIGFSNMVGIEHSFSAPNCECGVFASVQERLQCPANEPMKSFGSNAGLGWGLYYMVGADFNINFDWKAWGEELVEIFHDSLKY